MRQAKLHELVVRVLPIRLEDVPACDDAAQNRRGGIENRHSQDGCTSEQRRPHSDPRCQQTGEKRQREADEHAAGVAHEDARRVEVETDESGESTHQAQGHQNDGTVTQTCADEQKAQPGQCGRPSGQAVEPVDQVDAVADADVPENAETDRHPERERRAAVVQAGPHGDDASGCQKLIHKLGAGSQTAQVVDEPQAEHDQQSGQQCHDAACLLDAERCRQKRQQSQEEAAEDGDTTQVWNRVRVELTAVRLVTEAPLHGETAHRWHQQKRGQEGDSEWQDRSQIRSRQGT